MTDLLTAARGSVESIDTAQPSIQPIVLAARDRRLVPIPLDSLVRRVSELREFEPQVDADLRSALIEELNELEHRVELLWLRAESGVYVSAGDLGDCARTYLRLRERWTGSVAA